MVTGLACGTGTTKRVGLPSSSHSTFIIRRPRQSSGSFSDRSSRRRTSRRTRSISVGVPLSSLTYPPALVRWPPPSPRPSKRPPHHLAGTQRRVLRAGGDHQPLRPAVVGVADQGRDDRPVDHVVPQQKVRQDRRLFDELDEVQMRQQQVVVHAGVQQRVGVADEVVLRQRDVPHPVQTLRVRQERQVRQRDVIEVARLTGGPGQVRFDRVQQRRRQIRRHVDVQLHEVAEHDARRRAHVGADVHEVGRRLAAAGAVVVDDRRREIELLPAALRQRRGGEARLHVADDHRVEGVRPVAVEQTGVVPRRHVEARVLRKGGVDAPAEVALDAHLDDCGLVEALAEQVGEGGRAAEGVGVGVAVAGDEDTAFALKRGQELSRPRPAAALLDGLLGPAGGRLHATVHELRHPLPL